MGILPFPFRPLYSPSLPSKIQVNPLKPTGLGFMVLYQGFSNPESTVGNQFWWYLEYIFLLLNTTYGLTLNYSVYIISTQGTDLSPFW